ncbi:MAG: hypothetical protein ACHBN1_38625 [Heteroscytonema crispum UTEX LB 1556]
MKASRLGTNLIGCNVEGELEKQVNWAEVDAVEALIEELVAAGYCLNSIDSDNTIGVISPYRRQLVAWFAFQVTEAEKINSKHQDFFSSRFKTPIFR